MKRRFMALVLALLLLVPIGFLSATEAGYAFNPGNYSLRLSGWGINPSPRPVQGLTLAEGYYTLSVWVKGDSQLFEIHVWPGGATVSQNLILSYSGLSVDEWTNLTGSFTVIQPGWCSFAVQGSTNADEALYIDGFSLTLDGGFNLFENPGFEHGHFGWEQPAFFGDWRSGYVWTIAAHYEYEEEEDVLFVPGDSFFGLYGENLLVSGLSLEPGMYVFSVWVNMDSLYDVVFTLYGSESFRVESYDYYSDWVQHKLIFELPGPTLWMDFLIMIDGGVFLIDGLYLARVGGDGTNLLAMN